MVFFFLQSLGTSLKCHGFSKIIEWPYNDVSQLQMHLFSSHGSGYIQLIKWSLICLFSILGSLFLYEILPLAFVLCIPHWFQLQSNFVFSTVSLAAQAMLCYASQAACLSFQLTCILLYMSCSEFPVRSSWPPGLFAHSLAHWNRLPL